MISSIDKLEKQKCNYLFSGQKKLFQTFARGEGRYRREESLLCGIMWLKAPLYKMKRAPRKEGTHMNPNDLTRASRATWPDLAWAITGESSAPWSQGWHPWSQVYLTEGYGTYYVMQGKNILLHKTYYGKPRGENKGGEREESVRFGMEQS